MNLREFASVKDVAEENRVILLYCGPFSEGMLLALGDALKEKMANEETSNGLMRKVFSIFVEQAQNVIHYSVTPGAPPPAEGCGPRYGIIAIGHEDERYYVACENRVESRNVPRLKSLLESLSGLDREGIKKLFRRKLQEEPDAESKGAGLGILEIARRASEPIEYAFGESPPSGHATFTMKAIV